MSRRTSEHSYILFARKKHRLRAGKRDQMIPSVPTSAPDDRILKIKPVLRRAS